MSVKLRNERLVVTLATIPSRISRIRTVIESIKAQTRRPDRIYVCICKFCEWEQSSYDVPKWLADDADVQLVVSQRDHGPANKLLGMLQEETDPATRIVIVDDDWSYNPDMLKVLEERFEHYQRSAVGSSGARLPRDWSVMETRIGPEIHATPIMRHHLVFIAESPEDLAVDILQFGFGTIVLRKWFDDDIYDLVQPLEPLFFSDDVMFSGYLESKGVERVCVSGIPLPRLLDHWNVWPLHGEGRSTGNYKLAIPEISSRLNIWPPERLFDPPRPPALSVLQYWGLRAIRKTYRVAIRPLLQRAGLPVGRERKEPGSELNTIKNVARRVPGVLVFYRAIHNAYFRYLVKQARTERIFAYIYKKKLWGAKNSASGPGSDRHQTRAITEMLPRVFHDFKVSNMLDIPCGDFYWMNRVDRGDIDYLGADIVRDLIRENKRKYEKNGLRFQTLNLITDRLPTVDLILCRDCFIHFSFDDIFSALHNICDSQSDLVLTTTFIGRQQNIDILTGDWRPLNLEIAPLFLPRPLMVINERCTLGGGDYEDKSLALWRIEDIRTALRKRTLDW